jgi:predicted nuclease of predicted toxin-antitoxin system
MIFLANENFPFPSIRLLRDSSYRVISIIEEMPGVKDRDVLKKANQENLIILTFDRDYGELIYRYNLPVPYGLLYFRFDPDTPEEPAIILLNILHENHLPLISMFTTVERDRIRQRPL